MTERTPPAVSAAPIQPQVRKAAPQIGLRIAAGLSLMAGIVGLLGSIAVWSAPRGASDAGIAPTLNVALALIICVGSILIWHGRRLGAFLIVAAWVVPMLVNFALTGELRFSGLLLLLAVLTVGANWRAFR